MGIKEEKMINYLLAIDDYVSIEKISIECGISKRTVYNYLARIRLDPKYAISTKNNSVYLVKNEQDNEEKYSVIPEDYHQRKRWIFRKGLFLQKELDIDRVMDYFKISEATLHADIIKIRKEINKFHVKLVTKKGKLIFLGNYHDLKKLTQHVIYEENNENNSLLSTENLEEVFPNLDVKFIKNAINNELKNQNLFMDEYSIINLLLHILISTNQELNGIIPEINNKDFQVSNIIENICAVIERKYNLKFSMSSKEKFSVIIETRTKFNEELEDGTIKHEVTKILVNEIIQSLLVYYNIDFNDINFKRSFALHIDSMLTRLESKVNLNNPLFNIIKQSSPITYDLAIFVANIISKVTKYEISESEISYIALHIGTKIEELRTVRTRLKVAVVCPEFYMYNSNLNKMMDIFKDDLYITQVYISFDEINELNDVDLIICTIMPSKNIKDKEILKVSLFLNNEDKLKIMDAISMIKKNKRIERSRNLVLSLFKKNLFYTDIDFNDRDSAIQFMSNRLLEEGYVNKNYCEGVLSRERIAPTDFGMIAIPHPVECSANQTVISVCLLDKPLFWSRSNVSIIFMIGINNKDFEEFEDVLASIIEITENEEKIKELMLAGNYESFVNSFIELLNGEEI